MGNARSCLGREPGDEDPGLALAGTSFCEPLPAKLESAKNSLAHSPSGDVLTKLANEACPIKEPQPLPDSSPTKVAQTLPLPDKVAQPLPDSIQSGSGPLKPNLAVCLCIGAEASPDQQPVTGKPWDCKTLGAPTPPNNQERTCTGEALALHLASQCAELDLIMRTINRVFEAPYASMALYYNRRAWVTNSWDLPLGNWPWKVGACPWNCLVTQPQVIACGELQEDARFHHQPWVASGLRCYVSAPLLASNGHRMGTVCFMDTVPRRVDAGMCRVLSNFGELAIRVLERHIGLAQRLTAARQEVPHQLHTLVEAAYTGRDVRSWGTPGTDELQGLDEGHWDAGRPPLPAPIAAVEPLPADVLISSVFARQLRSSEVLKDACTLVVDTGVAGWTVMYADETWKLWSGYSRNELLGRPLQALLSPATPGVAPLNWAALQREVEGGERFVVPGVVALAPQAESSAKTQLQQQQQQQQCRIGQEARSQVQNLSLSAETNAFSCQPRLQVSPPADMASSRSNMAYDQDVSPAGKAHAGSAALQTLVEPDSVTDACHLSSAQGLEAPPASHNVEDLLSAVVQHESAAHSAHSEGYLSPASGRAGSGRPNGSGVELWHEAAAAPPSTRNNTPSGSPGVSNSNLSNNTNTMNTTNSNITGRFSLASSPPGAVPGGRVFDLSFRPLALDVLDEDALPLGVPSWVPLEACAPMLRLYAVRLHATMAAAQPPQPLTPSVKLTSVRSSTLQQLAGHLFPGLGMGQVLGRGGYGTAYTGTWHDVSVVVKVQDHQLDGMESLRTAQVEVALGQMLRHPHLVRTLAHGAAEVAHSAVRAPVPRFLDTSGQAPLETWSGMAGGYMTSPCPPHSQMALLPPQKPTHAGFSPLAKWILKTEHDWDGYGANSWFSHCSKDDMVRRTLITSNCDRETSTNLTMLRADQLPPPIHFINAVAVAPDVVMPPPTPAHGSRLAMDKLIEEAGSIELNDSFVSADSGSAGLADSTGSQASAVVNDAAVGAQASAVVNDAAVGEADGVSNCAVASRGGRAECSRTGSIHSAPTWALGSTRDISYLPVTGAPEPHLPRHKRDRTNAPPAANAGQARLGVEAVQPQEALLQVALGGVDGGGEKVKGDEGVQQPLGPLPADGSGLSPPSLPSSFLLRGVCEGRDDKPGLASSTLGAAGTSRGVSNSTLGNFNALQSLSTEMSLMMDSAQRHATHVGAKPMQFPMHLRTFAILEYCNGGTLQDAVDRGWLRKGSIHIDSPIDLSKVVTLASHVACAAAYLHERGVVHADLSAGNVLLCSKRPIVAAGQHAFLTARGPPNTTSSDTPTTNGSNQGTPVYKATALSGSESSWYTDNPTARPDSATAPGTTAPDNTPATTAAGTTAAGTTAAGSTAAGSRGGGGTNTNTAGSGGEELLYTLPTKRYSLAPSKARSADEFEFVAKVSDFGKSCLLGPEGVIKAGGYATVTHMAPEVLREHLLSPAADVYALGVLIWQMCTGSRPWAGMTHLQVYSTVISGRVELEWPDKIATTSPLEHRKVADRLVALGRTCLAHQAAARPTMAVVESELNTLAQQLAHHQSVTAK